MSKNPLTEQDNQYILDNYQTTVVSEMAKQRGINARDIYKFLYRNDLNPFVKSRKKKNREFAENCFDVNEREDWFI